MSRLAFLLLAFAGLLIGFNMTDAIASDLPLKLAFLGNSILYYNDCPRLMEQMIAESRKVEQNSCLRGGANLVSLLRDGNGMRSKFATPPARRSDGSYEIGAATVQELLESAPDIVIVNDHTQAPVREATRRASIKALVHDYMPLLGQATVVFLQTHAYRYPGIKDTEDLGDLDDFSDRLLAGYQEYQKVLEKHGVKTTVAPLGEAMRWLHHHRPQLWKQLYQPDHFHLSPSGTWLEACVLYCTILQSPPPPYRASWWKSSRRMQPEDEEPLPLPEANVAEELRQVACQICNVPIDASCEAKL